MTLASRSDRFMAQMLDSVVSLAPMIVVAIFAATLPESLQPLAEMLFLPALLFCLGYVIFADALPGGQSYGKRMLGILGLFDWIFILGERHQRLGDKAAGTIVVDEVPPRPAQVLYQ